MHQFNVNVKLNTLTMIHIALCDICQKCHGLTAETFIFTSPFPSNSHLKVHKSPFTIEFSLISTEIIHFMQAPLCACSVHPQYDYYIQNPTNNSVACTQVQSLATVDSLDSIYICITNTWITHWTINYGVMQLSFHDRCT